MVGVQPGSGAGLPMQISHGSQGFRQSATGTQGSQMFGSASLSNVHTVLPLGPVEPSHTYAPDFAGSSQQPKQSQPLGVSGPQYA